MDIRSLFSAFKDNIVRLFVSDVKVADNKITVTKSGSTTSYDLPKRITIDSELSDTSTNPVQNKAVKAAIPTKVSQLSNDSGYISEVVWDDVQNKPSTFTPSAHNQASNTITAMTGYSKPGATSAIVSSDTLNSAVGKLEKSLDGKAAKATTLAGYGITDAYTKTQVNTELGKKQNTISDLATIRSNASTGAGLSPQVTTNKNNIASLQTNLGKYLPLAGGTITGDIVPNADNAVTLGSDTKRFKEIYAHEVKLSTNSLYLGDTKILGTDANTINIKADAGQSLALKSQGSGTTNVQSFTGVSIETVAENGTNPDGSNIKIKALGDGSSITMIAPSIGITGATTVTNLNVTGNLSVAGTTTTVNSTNLEIKDNIIEINKGETGAGVTAGTAGVKIDRGENTDFFVVFDESDDKLKVGIGNENLTPVATESYVDTGLNAKLDANATAVSAAKLTKNAGSATQPVYFSNGVPVATTYTLGASVPSNAKFTDTTYSNATTGASGLMSASDKSKLDGVASGAEVNQNAFSNITVGSTTVSADSKTDTLTLVAGSNVTLTPDATNDKITIAAKDTTYSNATTSTAGLMSTSDKSKLDGVASGAEVNQNAFSNVVIGDATIAADAKTDTLTLVAGSNVTLTADATNDKITIAAKNTTYGAATSSTLGLVKTGSNITNSSGTISITKDNVTSALGYTPPTTNTTYGVATTSANGLMSSTDKSKLDGIAANANNYSLPDATSSVKGGVKVGSNITVSSGTISLTKANVTNALGYTPPTTDTNTHYTTHAKVGASATATANAAASNGSVYLNILDDSTVRDSHLIKGAGATTVTSDANGVITISSTDTNTNTTYSAGAGISLSGTTFSNSGVRSVAAGSSANQIKVNTGGTESTITVNNVANATSATKATQDGDGKTISSTYAKLNGATFTGDIVVNAPHRDTYYASNLCRHFSSNTPNQFVVKTKIQYISSSQMPVVRIYGYAYGLTSPIELRVGWYIYENKLGWAGVSCTGAWKPEVYLFSYTENSTKYVAIGFKGSCYFCGFQVDAQVGALGSFNAGFAIDGWSTINNGEDTSASLIPSVGTNDCIKVDYKPMQTDISGSASTATKATQDSAGQQINSTYIKGLSVSGKTITYTKGDGTTGTITTQDTNTTYSAGTGISLSGTTFNNSGVRSITAGSTANVLSVNTNGTTSSITINNVANASAATKATQDSAGQQINTTYIKGLSVSGKTITYTKGDGTTGTITTQDTNTDTKVTQSAVTDADYTNYRPIVWGSSNSSTKGFTPSTVTDGVFTCKGLYVQPSSGLIHATTFEGALSGNASTSTKATQDSAGQQITTTYIKGLSVSGKTITYTKGDGTTGTITTQDTNTTYGAATSSALGLVKIGSNITNSSGTISLTKANVTAALGYTPPTTDTNTWRGIQNNLTSDSTTDSLSAAQGKALKALVDGKAASSHTHNSVLDSGNNSSATTFAYSKAGLDTTSWFAAWNGYELRAISPAKTLSTIGAAAANHTHSYASVTKVTFTASDSKWGSASGGYYPLTIAHGGKNLFAVYRTNGSNYDRVAVSDTVSGSNNIIYSLEKFAGYALFI